jgi:hypothetical protein
MATREHGDPRPSRSTTTATDSGVTRYDLVLAIIPSAFIVALLAGHVLSLSMEASVVFASVVGVLALVDGLFLNPPEVGGGES